MVEIRVPFSIVYETSGVTPVGDVIEALQATSALFDESVALLPSLIDGLMIEQSVLRVRSLSQESPLRELFVVALFANYQDDLKSEVPRMLEDLLGVQISQDYDSIITVVFVTVVFYGSGLAIDAAKKVLTPSLPRARYAELVKILAAETGRSAESIDRIFASHFSTPSAARRLITQAKRVFLPSQRDRNAPMLVDRERIDSATIREIPYVGEAEKKTDFDRYTPYSNIPLELHAKDRDKSATGWAAVAPSITDKRLKLRVLDPVKPSELWGRDHVSADVVIVSKLTANGYVPTEIQLTKVLSTPSEA